MAVLGTASVEISPDFSNMRHLTPASGQLGRYTGGIRAAEEHSSKLSSTTKRLGSSLAGAAKYAAGAAVAYLSISQAEKAVSTTQDLTKTTIGLNQNLGIGIKRASEWGAVLQARGVDSTKAGMAFKTFATQVDSANKGSATSIDLFKELGVSQKDLVKDQGNVQKLLLDTSDGIDKLGAGTARTAAESKLFGRGWATVAPLMRDGSAALKDNLDLTKQYGDTLNQHTLKAQQNLLASQRESKIAWQGLQLQFTTAITPALEKVEGQFQRVARIMADPRLSNDQKFHRISHIIETDLSKALDFVVKEIPTVADHVGQEAPKIAEGLVNGFMDANIWGKLALGAFFVHKMGLGGPIVKTIGKRLGVQIGTEVAAGAAGGEAVGAAGAAGTALGTAIGTAAAVAAIAIIAKQVSDFLDNLAPTGKSHFGSEPGLPGKQGPPGASHIGLIPIPGTGGSTTARGHSTSAPSRAVALMPPAAVGTAVDEKGMSVIVDNLKALKGEFGSVGKAAQHMSADQAQGWIAAAKAAGKNGDISRAEMRRDIAAFRDTADNAQKSSKQQQQASKDTSEAAKKSGQQQQQSAQDTAKKVGASTDQQKSSSIKHSAQLAAGVAGNFGAMEGVVTAGLDILKGNVNKSLGSFGAKALDFTLENPGKAGKIAGQAASLLGLQGGGLASVVPGPDHGDKHTLAVDGIPIAKIAGSEGIYVLNSRAQGAALERWNSRMPHREGGGYVDVWGKGMAHLAKGGAISTAGLPKPNFDGHPSGVVPAVAAAISLMEKNWPGLGVTATTDGTHVAGSYHYQGKAVDMASSDYGYMDRAAQWVKTSGLYHSLLEGIHNPNLSVSDGNLVSPSYYAAVWAGHLDHIHLALDHLGKIAGGVGGVARVKKLQRMLLKGPAGPLHDLGQAGLDKAWKAGNAYIAKHAPTPGAGGSMGAVGPLVKPPKSLPPSLRKYDRRWAPHWAPDYGGPTMPVSKIAELAEWAGMPGVTMAQIAHGESGYRPGSAGVDPNGRTKGYGLWAITSPFHPEVSKYGGYEGMWNPISNALVAAGEYRSSGLSGWYGTRYLTDTNAHYSGPMKQKGGLVDIPWFGEGGRITANHPTLVGIGDKGKETATITRGEPQRPVIELHFHGTAAALMEEIVDEIEVRIDGDNAYDGQMSRMRR